jgi:hypothetical protein
LYSLELTDHFSDKTIFTERPSNQPVMKLEGGGPKLPPKIKLSAYPVALNPEFGKARRAFEKVLLEAPPEAIEVQLFYPRLKGVSNEQIEERIASLQNPKNRSVRTLYKRYAIAYLQEELRKRGQ